MTTEAMAGPPAASAAPAVRHTRTKPRPRSRAADPSLAGMLWFAGWLFTISFAKLVWWKALLGLIVWPFFLGQTVR